MENVTDYVYSSVYGTVDVIQLGSDAPFTIKREATYGDLLISLLLVILISLSIGSILYNRIKENL